MKAVRWEDKREGVRPLSPRLSDPWVLCEAHLALFKEHHTALKLRMLGRHLIEEEAPKGSVCGECQALKRRMLVGGAKFLGLIVLVGIISAIVSWWLR